MELNRWHIMAALTCSLSLEGIALAQTSQTDDAKETPGVTGSIVIPGEFEAADVTDPKFVIGVSLSEVSESLRAHVSLPEGVGLLVGSIVPESPAALAGLQQYDILLKAGETDLKHPKELQTLVDSSEGKSVSISRLRKGELETIVVTPIPRADLQFPSTFPTNGEFNLPSPMNFTFMIPNGQLPPGVSIPGTEGSPEQMEALTESIRSLTEQIERLKRSIDRIEKQQGDQKDSGESENNRAKEDGDCWKLAMCAPGTS